EVDALLVHGVGLELRGLERDRPLDLGEDLLPHALGVVGLLRHERGVGGHAAEHAPAVDLADLLDVGGVQEQLHGRPPWVAWTDDGARASTRSLPVSPREVRSVARSITRSMMAASARSKL